MPVPLFNFIKILVHKLLKPLSSDRQLLLIKKILNKNYREGSSFIFVQVGAHDGISHDTLYDFIKKRKARGVVIEPLFDMYERLVINYSYNPGIITVNKAVHPTLKKVDMYRVDPAQHHQFPEWSSGIASLFPDHHQRSGIPASAMIREEVAADHLSNIITAYQWVSNIDLLQIDVEGFDYQVLKQVDFKKLNPAIIKFEYVNLQKGEVESAIQLLKLNGYVFFYEGLDIVAVQLRKIRL